MDWITKIFTKFLAALLKILMMKISFSMSIHKIPKDFPQTLIKKFKVLILNHFCVTLGSSLFEAARLPWVHPIGMLPGYPWSFTGRRTKGTLGSSEWVTLITSFVRWQSEIAGRCWVLPGGDRKTAYDSRGRLQWVNPVLFHDSTKLCPAQVCKPRIWNQ